MVTIWHPEALDGALPRYRAIAAALSDDIGRGRLAPGDRLPTMRALAEALGVTLGTVYRAYALAERRGQISRQKGRGSFVRGRDEVTGSAEKAAAGVVDLSRNEPPDLRIEEILRRSLIEMARECDLVGMLSYGNSQGQPRHRECLARWVRRHGFAADPGLTIITSGAQQALTVALGALSEPGDTLLVEALTYPGIKNLARIFGLRLQAVAIDAEGLLPEALSAACRAGRPGMLYCMPNLHNPTTATLGAARRGEIARIAAEHGLIVVEDDVNPRLTEGPPPIATLYPERTVYISSLSKTMAPGLRVGALCSPPALFSELLAAAQTTNWMAPPLMAELASRWIEEGTAELLEEERDRAARRLQEIAASCLAGLDHRSAEDSWNLWLPLPAGWSGRDFAAKALERGVIVTAGEDFAIDPAQPVPAVRICLSEVGEARLRRALGEIARLAGSGPGPVAFAM